MRCAVYGCCVNNLKKTLNGEISFHSFPKEKKICKQWVFLCRRKDQINLKNARVCSKHFTENDFIPENPFYKQIGMESKIKRLNPNAVPSLLLPLKKQEEAINARSSRIQKRSLNLSSAVAVEDFANGNELQIATEEIFLASKTCSTQTQVSTNECGTQTQACKTDSGTQTLEIVPSYFELQEEIVKLKAEIWKQKQIIDSISKIFTTGQLKKLESPDKRCQWSEDDIANAIAIHAAGPRAYRLLLRKKYPLPAVVTLKKWCSKIEVYPGLIQPVLNIMKNVDMKDLHKICVLSFDEMKVKEKIVYDKRKDETLKAAKYVQVAMIRGLFGNWKQPIFYGFDQRMTKDILFSIINAVHECGFQVTAMVCDLGGTNQGLLRELEITVTESSFPNPSNPCQHIHVFADVPHLLKLIRNNFVDNAGFDLDGETISKEIVEELLTKTNNKSDLSIAYKISASSLNVRGAERQKVKLATKLFSHTVSKAILRAGTLGELSTDGWFKCSEFFKQVNDWFDCLNVRAPYADSRERVHGVGLSESIQFEIVDKMTETMLKMRVKGKKNLMPFQKGIVMTNNSLKNLYKDLTSRYEDISYLLTYRLNQDVLENFFGVIRSKGGLYDHPNRLEFMFRLRSYILGRNEGSLSLNGNTLVDDTPDLEAAQNLSSSLFKTLALEVNATDAPEPADELESLQYDGLEHLAGYICHRLNDPNLVIPSNQKDSSFTWTNELSEGFLQKPTYNMMTDMEKMELIFKDFNGDEIVYCSDYTKQLINLSTSVSLEPKAKEIFFRSRMFFRIKHLNKATEENSRQRKRKINKTVS